MVPKFYPLLQRCIEEGVRYGYARAHKHGDFPPETTVRAAIEDAIMAEINEWFDFPEATSPGG